MRVIIQRLFGNRIGGSSELSTTYEIAYDESAPERAYDLITGLQRHNYQPRRLVAGLRAYLSLYANVARVEERGSWDYDALRISILAAGSDDFRFQFQDVDVELDMTTEDPDDLRVTCGGMGLALVCAAQPDVQVHETMQALFSVLRQKVVQGRKDHIQGYADPRAMQLGFSDGDEKHVVRLVTLRSYYDAPHFRPLGHEAAMERYNADMDRLLRGDEGT